MNRYQGTFMNKDNSITTVIIIPYTGEYDSTVELKFPFDEPVIITQESDGIFTPIKTKSCTIKIWTEEIYWELYSGNPTQWYVVVKKTENSTDTYLFNGYLTPCAYTLDYAYKGELELECVDALAILEQRDYTAIGDEIGIYTVNDILYKIFCKIPQYNYSIFSVNRTDYDMTAYKLQEANFFDDDGEPMTCKEILEQICLYFGITAVMDNNKIALIKYDKVNSAAQITLDTSKYGAGTPTVELDDVYSKIDINCSLSEVGGDDLMYDLWDDDYINRIVNGLKYETDGSQLYSIWDIKDNHAWVKPYYFIDNDFISKEGNSKYKVGNWKSLFYYLDRDDSSVKDYALCDDQNISTKFYNDTQLRDYTSQGATYDAFVPYYKSAYPMQYYYYNIDNAKPTSINWDKMILFSNFDYTYWQRNHYTENGYDYFNGDAEKLQQVVLQYTNNNNLPYSIQGGTSWITFKGDLWYQTGSSKSKVYVYYGDSNDRVYYPFPLDGVDTNSMSESQKRADMRNPEYHADELNRGFDVLKCKLLIGDKYFQGFTWDSTLMKYVSNGWSTTETFFYIPYHDEDVNPESDEIEYLHYYQWVKPITNTDYTDKVGEECFAIPIEETDKVSGKLTFSICTPKGWYAYHGEKGYSGENVEANIWMKNLDIDYKFTDDSNWADDETVDDDIVYENVITDDYSSVKDDITLKINSWYEDKPISKSYVLDTDNMPIQTIGEQPQEANLLDMYVDHYGGDTLSEKKPKKIFNLNYKTLEPSLSRPYYHTSTDTKYIVDSYEMDVHSGETNLKLIEI